MLDRSTVLGICLILATGGGLLADDEASVKGTMTLQRKTYKLTAVKAFGIKSDGRDAIAVIVGTKPFVIRNASLFPPEKPSWISIFSIHKAGTRSEPIPVPASHFQLIFDAKTGKPMSYQGWINNETFMAIEGVWNGEIRMEGKAVVGKAKHKSDFPQAESFDLEFTVSIEALELGNDIDENLAAHELRISHAGVFYRDPFKESLKEEEGQNTDHVRAVGFDERWRDGDEGLKYLKYLPKLSTIYLLGNPKISEKALADFKKALPDVVVEHRPKFDLGIEGMRAVGAKGYLVTQVTPDSPAATSGLKKGDLITQFDDTVIKVSDDLTSALNSADKSGAAKLTVTRDGKTLVVKVALLRWW